MEIISKINKLKAVARKHRGLGHHIGFVPTMGALHEGHLSLVRRAQRLTSPVVVSIFVNPAQFGANEDFDKYPRNLSHDVELLTKAGVDYVFAPAPDEIYPKDFETYISVEELSGVLCGRTRPGHFRGVATVVAKLFAVLEPDLAFFGQKDAQQVVILRKMARDLNFPSAIQSCPIVRESDGLAMSSRNSYLSSAERRAAPVLYRSLCHAAALVLGGEQQAGKIRQQVQSVIESEPLAKTDYVEIVDNINLQPVETVRGECLLAVAVYFGKTRLIDNLIIAGA